MTGEGFADVGRGIRLCFEQIGDPQGIPLVMVAGLGQQLVSWPTPLCQALADSGLRVIRFDNRDAGRSTHVHVRPPRLAAVMCGRVPSDAYHLGDLARDTVGLFDALGLQRAHLVGASMGGMIAQVVASRWPHRVCSLTSMMSTTGARRVGRPRLSTWLKMAGRPPRTVEEAARADLRIFRHIGSHGFAFDQQSVAEQARLAWGRDPRGAADGAARQLAAIFAAGDRTAELARVSAPTLVIHGDRDRMVAPSGGLVTARAIRGAKLLVIPGMGHDYPREVWPRLVDAIVTHVRAAEACVHADEPGASASDASAAAPAQQQITPGRPDPAAGVAVPEVSAVSAKSTRRRPREKSQA